MRIKITRPDGTVIEAEGTAEECERIAAPPVPVVSPTPFDTRPVVPFVVPSLPHPWDQPWWGVIPPSTTSDRITIEWSDVCGTILPATTASRAAM